MRRHIVSPWTRDGSDAERRIGRAQVDFNQGFDRLDLHAQYASLESMGRTARWIYSGLLSILVVAAIGAGLYLLAITSSGGNIRSRTLFAFAPAAMLAWLLSRVWPKSHTVRDSAPPVAPAPPIFPEAPDDPYTFVGACSPIAAEALLAKLKQNEVRFLIDVVKPRPRRFGGPSVGPSDSIKIFVHNDDMPEAESILSSLGKKLGTL